MSKYKKGDFDYNEDDYDIEDYLDLDDRIEEYLEHLDHDPYSSYYEAENNRLNNKNETLNNHSRDDFYDSLLKIYVKDLERITKNLNPTAYTVISGSGPAWFYDPLLRQFIKTERGSEVVVIPGGVDEYGRLMVRTMGTFLLVPEEDILDIGYN